MVALLPLLALAQSEEAGFTADRPGATTGVNVLPGMPVVDFYRHLPHYCVSWINNLRI